MLPVVLAAIAAPTHSVVDAGLRSLPVVLPVLDFSTIKNELFPVVAHVFSKTNSLAIKLRGLQAFVILCGGTNDTSDDGLDGFGAERKKTSSSTALDKYTMQEKIVPLVRAIKTKEPAVMIAALNVLRIVGDFADAEFVAMDILPILWNMSLGPLLNLKQFQTFMDLIKSLSRKVEDEQIKKLQELSGVTNGPAAAPAEDFMSFGGISGSQFDVTTGATEDDFERLVKGKSAASPANPMNAGWDDAASSIGSPGLKVPTSKTAAFSWSTPSPTTAAPASSALGAVKAQQPSFRTVTPDLNSFAALSPSSTQFSQPLQPANAQSAFPTPPVQPASGSLNWSTTAAAAAPANPWASTASKPSYPAQSTISPPPTSNFGGGLSTPMSSMSLNQQRPSMGNTGTSSFSLPPPPGSGGGSTPLSGFSLQPPPQQQQQSNFGRPTLGTMGSMGSMGSQSMGMGMGLQRTGSGMAMGTGMGLGMGGTNSNSMNSMGFQQPQQQKPAQPPPGGLDKYESLL